MTNLNYCLTLLTLGLLLNLQTQAQHFQTVWSNNPYMPMSIIVDSAFLDSIYLQLNDEIAVFDTNASGNKICVGVIVIESTFAPDTNYVITASADDPTTPEQDGFIDGHEIIYRFWDTSYAEEVTLIKKNYKPGFDINYQSLGTAVAALEGFSAMIWTGTADSNWHNTANWNMNSIIPDSTIRVLIPAWCTVSPVIYNADADCKTLKIEQGSCLKTSGSAQLQVYE